MLPAEDKEGIESWLEGCDEGFRKVFITFLRLYKHRLDYSKGYEWESKLEDVISDQVVKELIESKKNNPYKS